MRDQLQPPASSPLEPTRRPVNHTSKRRLLAGAIVAWGGIILAGVLLMADRDTRPAESSGVLRSWPSDTNLARSPDKSNVVLFAHPQCPCTRATLRELERVVARCGELASVQVLLCLPDGAPSDFDQSELRQQAEAIPGVRVSSDAASAEARHFGAQTSGEVLAFGPDGRLRFQGGITGARGHEGDNAGRDALIAALREDSAALRTSPVFGCSLFEDEGAERAPAFDSHETTP